MYLASQVENYDDDFDGEIDQKIYYTYDANGNETKREIDEGNNGDIDETHEFSYDDKNNVVKEISTVDEVIETYTAEITYDSSNRMITVTEYLDGELYRNVTREYGYDDARGQNYHISSSADKNGEVVYIEKVFFDDDSFTLDHVAGGYGLDADKAYYNKFTRDEYHNHTALDYYEEYHSYDGISATELAAFIEEDLSDDLQYFTWETEYDSHGEFLVRSKLELSEQTNLRAFVNTYSDGSVTSFTDADGDTIPAAYDCDDTNSAITLRSEEGCDDLGEVVDDNVSTRTYYRDADNDNYGDLANPVESNSQPDGYVTNDDDCDDTDPDIGDDKDTLNVDADGDGFGDTWSWDYVCVNATGYVDNSDDCDDTNSAIGDVDMDYLYPDADGDGYGANSGGDSVCVGTAGYVEDYSDCDDGDDDVNPGRRECVTVRITRDGKDNDCDGAIDEVCTFNIPSL